MSETVAAAFLSTQRDRTVEPTLRAALESLLSDEVTHGRFGWELLAHFAPLTEHDRASLTRFLEVAFVHWEREMKRRVHNPTPFPARAEELGCVAPEEGMAIFEEVVREAVVPGLSRHGVDAAHVWSKRHSFSS